MSFSKKTFDEILLETNDMFKNTYGIDVGRNFYQVCGDEQIRADLIESYTYGMNANDQAVVQQLMENATEHVLLTESGIAADAKVASMSFPVIRKLWASTALKNALAIKVAETPAIAVMFSKPYIIDTSGQKQYILGGDTSAREATMGKPTATRGVVLNSENGWKAVVDLKLDPTADGYTGDIRDVGTATVKDTNSSMKVQGLDMVDISVALEIPADETIPETSDIDYGYANVDIVKKRKVGIDNHLTIKDVRDGVKYEVIASVDKANSVVTVFVVGLENVTVEGDEGDEGVEIGIIIDAEISQEFHETPTSVSIEYSKREVIIPSGEHFSTNITVESTQDLKALYNIDNVSERVSAVTNIVAQNLEIEMRNFIEDAIADRTTDEFDFVGSSSEFTLTFDCNMESGFLQNPNYALSASSWRSEITKTIDYLATKIITEMHYKKGIFKVIGNPMDTQLIPNVNWEFSPTSAVDGIDISYSKGFYKGVYQYELISSPFYKQGSLALLFIPSSEERALTYVYYPYSFNTETSGYIDRSHSRVPSIMVTKRHAIEKFMPASGKVVVLNNNPFA